MAKIFLSYRRRDPLPNWNVKRIGAMCEDCGFEEVFVDRDKGSIPHGSDYREEIKKAIRASDVLLVLIGDRWQSIMNEKWDDTNDMVQVEISLAMKLGKTVVPILLGGAMPGLNDLPEHICDFHYRNGKSFEPDTMDTQMPVFLRGLLGVAPIKERLELPLEKTIDLGFGVDMCFCFVPAGSFLMGDELQHKVTLTEDFWLGKYPVTQGQWKAVMRRNLVGLGRFFGGGKRKSWENLPVEQVSWWDAEGFSAKVGKRLRLPTEAEWEYACRAGTTGDYNVDGVSIFELGWFGDNSGDKTHAVGEKLPNAWGLHDMHGNVWEWCWDWYGDYPESEVTNPMGPGAADPKGPGAGEIPVRVTRGGAHYTSAERCRSAHRFYMYPDVRKGGRGFRLVMDR